MSKSKSKKPSENESIELVLNYLNEQNRPFSHKLVFENLHGKDIGLAEAKVKKILEDLASAGKCNTKIFKGKNVYWASQERFGEVDSNVLKDLDEKAADLKDEVLELREAVGQIEKRNRDLAALPLSSQLDSEVAKLEQEHKEISSRLEAAKSGGRKVDEKQKARLEKLHAESKKEWKRRKRLFSEMSGTLEENLDDKKKFKKLKEDLGIETDEALKVQPDDDNLSRLLKKNS